MEKEIKQETEQQEKEAFKVDTEEKADWALRKYREIKAQITKVQKRADNERKVINDWESKEVGSLQDKADYFTMLLNEYADDNRDKDGKFKFSSPYGRIYTRKNRKWSYDVDKLVDEYKQTEVVVNVPKLDKNELKKRIEWVDGKPIDKETGAIVDGVGLTDENKVYIKTEED